jgi:hypothetical protein
MPECESLDDCDDGNECTDDTCTDGTCGSTPVADDTACGDGAATCQEGSCAGTFACTEQGIRDAIAVRGGPHTFDCDGPTTVVTEAEIVIDNDVILDGEGNLTVDGDDDHRVFSVAEGVTAELRGLTVTRGHDAGGGIGNGGTLTLTNSTVSGNRSSSSKSPEGGGIINDGTLTLTNSTVSGNSAGIGGGILNFGTLTLTNSTVSGNGDSDETYGGIFNEGTLTLTNSTVSGNLGRAIFNEGTLTLTNSVVEGDCGGGGDFVSDGYNVESPGDTCGFDQEGDQIDVTEGELNLGPLQDNGGPTMTHTLLSGSVAIDQIPVVDCVDAEGEPLTTDQRGFPRDSMCDVGAFERQPDDPEP